MNPFLRVSLLSLIFLAFSSCVSYHEKNIAFQKYFSEAKFAEANETLEALDKNKKASTGKDRLLFFLQKGTVLQELGLYEESNEYFEKAYIFTEDYRKNNFSQIGSYTINGETEPYLGEDHELVLLHYYKALNFLFLKKFESALVECRRINNKLNFLNDRYEEKKNIYKKDAFALNLMGIIYEAPGEYNDAFIAYKNSVDAYESIYASSLATPIPLQLQKDVLRMANANGFSREVKFYQEKFNLELTDETFSKEQLVFFWHNGLAPVKQNRNIDFVVSRNNNNKFFLVNDQLGYRFRVPDGKTAGLSSLNFVRMAFPKYVERRPYYTNADILMDNGQRYILETGENINTISFQTLDDRVERELGTSLVRLAVKQATYSKVSDQSQNLGVLVSVLNATTEKADTRNWQTLPYSISYSRVPLSVGDNHLIFNLSTDNQNSIKKEYNIHCEKNEFLILVDHTLESSTVP